MGVVPLGWKFIKVNKMNNIVVSVYITTQNRPELLRRAIKSLKYQTYKNFEVIVCDDCSTIDNQKLNKLIIDEFSVDFISVTYLLNPTIKGACYSRNQAIKFAKGKYITGLDDDDVFHKERLKAFMGFPEKEKYSFICANCKKLDYHYDEKLKVGGREISEEKMRKFNAVGNQVFIEKKKLITVNGFDEEMPAWQDYDTWFRLILTYGKAFKLNACTMYLDDDENRQRITTSSKAYNGYSKFIDKHKDKLSIDDLLSLSYMDKVNRKQRINYLTLLKSNDKELLIRVIKYSLAYQLPMLYRIYEKIFK